MSYIPRNHRPERKEALAALKQYLDANPGLRIGQALYALSAMPFVLEDIELIHAVRQALSDDEEPAG